MYPIIHSNIYMYKHTSHTRIHTYYFHIIVMRILNPIITFYLHFILLNIIYTTYSMQEIEELTFLDYKHLMNYFNILIMYTKSCHSHCR